MCEKKCLTAQRDLLKVRVNLSEHRSVGVASSHPNPDSTHRDMDLGCDLEQLQANRGALRPREFGTLQPEPSQGLHQHVRHR